MEKLEQPIIELRYGYYVSVEPRCYVLHKKYISKSKKAEGKEIDTEIGYFGDFTKLMERYIYLARIVSDPTRKELMEYAKTIDHSSKLAIRGLHDVLKAFQWLK